MKSCSVRSASYLRATEIEQDASSELGESSPCGQSLSCCVEAPPLRGFSGINDAAHLDSLHSCYRLYFSSRGIGRCSVTYNHKLVQEML